MVLDYRKIIHELQKMATEQEMSGASGDEQESTELYERKPSGKRIPRHTRIWPATYVCIVAACGFLLFGLSRGFNSPVLSDLKSRTGYTSLHRTLDQDLFNVCGSVRGVTNSRKKGTDFKILNKFLKISQISKDFTKSNESCKI